MNQPPRLRPARIHFRRKQRTKSRPNGQAHGIPTTSNEATAEEALAAARVQGGSAAAGQQRADQVIGQIGSAVLIDPQVSVTRTPTTATVEVHATAERWVPPQATGARRGGDGTSRSRPGRSRSNTRLSTGRDQAGAPNAEYSRRRAE